MTAAVTRPTNLVAPSQLLFMGFARAPRAAKGEIGEPGKGAPQPTSETAGGGRGRGPAGRGVPPPAVAPVAPAAAAAVPPSPTAAPQPGRGRGPNAIFAVASDGIVRTLNPINGDAMAPPVKLLPPNSNGSGLIQADDVLYAVTSNGCGGVPDAVWAMDWSRDEKPVVSWKSNGAPVAGPA